MVVALVVVEVELLLNRRACGMPTEWNGGAEVLLGVRLEHSVAISDFIRSCRYRCEACRCHKVAGDTIHYIQQNITILHVAECRYCHVMSSSFLLPLLLLVLFLLLLGRQYACGCAPQQIPAPRGSAFSLWRGGRCLLLPLVPAHATMATTRQAATNHQCFIPGPEAATRFTCNSVLPPKIPAVPITHWPVSRRRRQPVPCP